MDYIDPQDLEKEKMKTDMAAFNVECKIKFFADVTRALQSLVSLLVIYCKSKECVIGEDRSFVSYLFFILQKK